MKNNYRIEGNDVFMELNQRGGGIIETVFDLADLDKVKEYKYKWCPKWRESTQSYYVQSSKYMGIVNGKPKYQNIYLHKYITGTNKDVFVDHIDNDTLNNRKSNFRFLDNQKNLFNRKGANRNSTTGVRNVTYDKTNNIYIVQFQIEGKNTRIGTFNSLKDAKLYADKNREKYYKIN